MSYFATRIRHSDDGQWYFVGIGFNNEVIFTSETYTRPEDARRAMERFFPDESSQGVCVTGVWLRGTADVVEVLLEMDGDWISVIQETTAEPSSDPMWPLSAKQPLPLQADIPEDIPEEIS